MKAVVCRRFGLDGIASEEVEPPTAGVGEVLIRVRAAAVNALDWHLLRGTPYGARVLLGLLRPRTSRPGRDVAGEVEAVGGNVTRCEPGDAVFGVCRGAFAEFACAAERNLAFKPGNVTFEQAAAVPIAGLTALQGLRDSGRIRAGQQVLIHGAGGGVGSLAVQVAKTFGAEVTAVTSTDKLDTVRALGADRVLDHSREDYTAGDRRFDLIFDCHADRPLAACGRVLRSGGRYVVAGGPFASVSGILAGGLARAVRSLLSSRKYVSFMARVRPEDLARLAELLAAGTLTPVIGRRYQLSEVPAAIRDLAEGRVRGKLVVTV